MSAPFWFCFVDTTLYLNTSKYFVSLYLSNFPISERFKPILRPNYLLSLAYLKYHINDDHKIFGNMIFSIPAYKCLFSLLNACSCNFFYYYKRILKQHSKQNQCDYFMSKYKMFDKVRIFIFFLFILSFLGHLLLQQAGSSHLIPIFSNIWYVEYATWMTLFSKRYEFGKGSWSSVAANAIAFLFTHSQRTHVSISFASTWRVCSFCASRTSRTKLYPNVRRSNRLNLFVEIFSISEQCKLFRWLK